MKVKWGVVARVLKRGGHFHYSKVDEYTYIGNETFLIKTLDTPSKTVQKIIEQKGNGDILRESYDWYLKNIEKDNQIINIDMVYKGCQVLVNKDRRKYIWIDEDMANMVTDIDRIFGGDPLKPLQFVDKDEFLFVFPMRVVESDDLFLKEL